MTPTCLVIDANTETPKVLVPNSYTRESLVDVEIPIVIRCTVAGIPHALQVVKREMGLQFEHTYLLDGRIVVRPPQTKKNLNDQSRER